MDDENKPMKNSKSWGCGAQAGGRVLHKVCISLW